MFLFIMLYSMPNFGTVTQNIPTMDGAAVTDQPIDPDYTAEPDNPPYNG